MRSTGITTTANRAGGVLLLALLLASCGDDGSGDGGSTISPTISTTRTPNAEAPSASEPTSDVPTTEPTEPAEPTTEPTSEEPPPEPPSPTRTPERTERPDEPETPLTSEPSEPAPAPAPETDESEPAPAPETVTVSPEAQEPEAEPAEDDGVPTWVGGLAAAVVLGLLVAIPLMVRARRRTAWRQALASAEGELAWLAQELLPELRRAGSREEVAGGWAVSEARVSAVEDRLTVLESSAPDDQGRSRALVLRDASRAARAQMQRLLSPGPRDTWALDLDAVINDLETALRPSPVTSPG